MHRRCGSLLILERNPARWLGGSLGRQDWPWTSAEWGMELGFRTTWQSAVNQCCQVWVQGHSQMYLPPGPTWVVLFPFCDWEAPKLSYRAVSWSEFRCKSEGPTWMCLPVSPWAGSSVPSSEMGGLGAELHAVSRKMGLFWICSWDMCLSSQTVLLGLGLHWAFNLWPESQNSYKDTFFYGWLLIVAKEEYEQETSYSTTWWPI